MMKVQELAVIDSAIAKLGPDSYLGPWLKEVRVELADNLMSDIMPDILPSTLKARAEAEAALLIQTARLQAAALTLQATKEADRLYKDATSHRQRAIDALESVLKSLTRTQSAEWIR